MLTDIANMHKYQSEEYRLDDFIIMYVVKLSDCYCVSICDHWDQVEILPEQFIETAQEVYDLYIEHYKKQCGF